MQPTVLILPLTDAVLVFASIAFGLFGGYLIGKARR